MSLFSKKETAKLLPHHYIDHKIPLRLDTKQHLESIYLLSFSELEAVVNYLKGKKKTYNLLENNYHRLLYLNSLARRLTEHYGLALTIKDSVKSPLKTATYNYESKKSCTFLETPRFHKTRLTRHIQPLQERKE